ncbi:MAG: cytochrome c biogenesis protein CcdA [Gammaproteobacteria bacterium]|nr:cytochrome c biogenesis protein CcdA [Gammaproteobacteria bacterium]
MMLGIGSLGFGLLAGILSTLSPCVLPLLPILLGAAAAHHSKAPLALAGGLALSYAVIGTTLAWAGVALGLDAATFRNVGAMIVGLLGAVLLSATLQQGFARVTSGLGNAGNRLVNALDLEGLRGQFYIGLTLGIVWSPCVGPTLGTAIVLASRGTHLFEAALVMAVFGVGAALPILVISAVSRAAAARARGNLLRAGRIGKAVLGCGLIVLAVLILTGLDKAIESRLVAHTPAWLTALTTRF